MRAVVIERAISQWPCTGGGGDERARIAPERTNSACFGADSDGRGSGDVGALPWLIGTHYFAAAAP